MKNILLFILTVSSLTVFGKVSDQASFTAVISEQRDSIKLITESKNSYPLVCSGVKLIVQLENPRLYMHAGEFNEVINKVFLYPKSQNRITVQKEFSEKLSLINSESVDKIIIKSLDLDTSKIKCHRATFYQYCTNSNLDDFEKYSITELGRVFRKTNCKSLSFKMNKKKLGFKKTINLNDTNIMDFRFLEYLTSVKSIYVNNTFKDKSGVLDYRVKSGLVRASILSTQRELPLSPNELKSYISEEETLDIQNFDFKI